MQAFFIAVSFRYNNVPGNVLLNICEFLRKYGLLIEMNSGMIYYMGSMSSV